MVFYYRDSSKFLDITVYRILLLFRGEKVSRFDVFSFIP